jgi:UDP-N-acetyl-2-amino-2-deoxyglucuronate dehydrogenase
MLNFALIGVGGYIAPRHLKAIKDTGNNLIAALDPNDSVGIIDSFYPDVDFFSDFERFERHVEQLKLSSSPKKIDYVSICSPNHLHDAHIRLALRSEANAICEKPLVLNPHNIDRLIELEANSKGKVYTILQLRLHPAIIKLKEVVNASPLNQIFDVDLTYITSRGNWYHYSWKGDESKSGGIATNIGVHFYDMLHFLFGNLKKNVVNLRTKKNASGYLEYDRARVRWFLSVDSNDLPIESRKKGMTTHRSLNIDGKNVEFSDGFMDLHTRVYEDILSGGGFGLEDNRVAIETVSEIRNQIPIGLNGEYHPYLKTIKL